MLIAGVFVIAVAYQAFASYLISPSGLRYPNPGHYPEEIGPGSFNCSGNSNCYWRFPGNVKVMGNLTANKINASEICLNGNCKTNWQSGGEGIGVVCKVNPLTCYWKQLYCPKEYCEPLTVTCNNPGEVITGVKADVSYGLLMAPLGVRCCKEICGKPAILSNYFYDIHGKTRSEVNAEIASREPGYHWCSESELPNYPLVDLFSDPRETFQQGYDKNDYGAVARDDVDGRAKICSSTGECHWIWLHECSNGIPCDRSGRCCKTEFSWCFYSHCSEGWDLLASIAIWGDSDSCDSDNHKNPSYESYKVDWFNGRFIGYNGQDRWWYNDQVRLCYNDTLTTGNYQKTRLWLCPND